MGQDARTTAALVAVSLFGMTLAFVAGRVTAPQADGETASTAAVVDTEHTGAESDRLPDVPRVERHSREPPVDAAGSGTGADDSRSPPTLNSQARTAREELLRLEPDASAERIAEVEQMAEQIRLSAKGTHARAAVDAARTVAEAMAEERAFLADQARGGTMEMLKALSDAGARPFALVEDPTVFSTHFQRATSGPEVDGAARPKTHDAPESGSTIRYPDGEFELAVSRWGGREGFPEDLLIEGAGRDRTTLRFDEFNARGQVRSLTFRDVTVHANDNYLFDLRSQEPVTVRFERCRVVGFDMGAGGSVMLAARVGACYATDTLFEAGYGRHPGSGNLFRVGGGFLARLERCEFIGPFRSLYDLNGGSTYVFQSCRFVNQKVPLDGPPTGVRFHDCELAERDPDEIAGERLTASLAALDRDWSGATAVDGVSGTLDLRSTDPVVVTFPGGVHEVRPELGLNRYRGPVKLRGQGKDATLLRQPSFGSMSHVVVEDATLNAQSFTPAHSPAIRMDRVRLIGWDSGAGGSTAIDHRRAAVIHLRDCEILGGFGGAPGLGTCTSLSSGATLLLERCVLTLDGSAFVRSVRSGGPVHLVDTTVTGAAEGSVPSAEGRADGGTAKLVSTRSSISTVPKGTARRKEPRPLSDLNPNW